MKCLIELIAHVGSGPDAKTTFDVLFPARTNVNGLADIHSTICGISNLVDASNFVGVQYLAERLERLLIELGPDEFVESILTSQFWSKTTNQLNVPLIVLAESDCMSGNEVFLFKLCLSLLLLNFQRFSSLVDLQVQAVQ